MSWKKIPLSKLCVIEKGKIGINKAIPGEYPLVTTAEERLSHNEYHFDGNAVIIPLVSSTGHGHRSLKRIHYQTGKFSVGSILAAVMPKDEKVLRADYLFRFLCLNKENELVGRMRGMANVTLPVSEIGKIEIPLPPVEKQIEFVNSYTNLEKRSDSFSYEFTHQLDLVKQLRQAFLREAMQGKLVPQDPNEEPASVLLEKIKAEKERLIKEKKIKKGKPLPPITKDEIPYELPEGWVWCRIDKITFDIDKDIKTGPFGSSLNKSEHKANGIPVWGIESISKKGMFTHKNKIFVSLEKAEELKMFEVKSGDLIISRSGTIGELCVIPRNVSMGLLSTNLMKISVDERVMLPEVFCHIIKGSSFIKQMLKNLCSGSTRLFLTQKILKELLFPLPPISEQYRIVAKLDQLMQYCDQLEAGIRQSQQHNEQLLQQVLREALEG